MNVFRILSLLHSLLLGFDAAKAGYVCPAITAEPTMPHYGRRLKDHVYKNFTSETVFSCYRACEKDKLCQSANFLQNTKQCQFNRDNSGTRPESYILDFESAYLNNTSYRVLKGSTNKVPAKSCKDIVSSGDSTGTKYYWLDPTNSGAPFKAFCDMSLDGGGWTAIRFSEPNETSPRVDETTDAYHRMGELPSNVLITAHGLRDLRRDMGFTQLRFFCHKERHGRTFHVMTKNNTLGKAVVDFFIDRIAAPPMPQACESFIRLPDDTSSIAKPCNDWGQKDGAYNVNKWSFETLLQNSNYTMIAVYAPILKRKTVNFMVDMRASQYKCDDADSFVNSKPRPGDKFAIFVR